MNIKNFIVLFVKGMFIGIANAIPGVSGGTLAFVLGVYEKLTFAISELPKSILRPREFFRAYENISSNRFRCWNFYSIIFKCNYLFIFKLRSAYKNIFRWANFRVYTDYI